MIDPSEHTVAQVLEYAEAHPGEASAIRDAELKADKPRVTLISGLEEFDAVRPEDEESDSEEASAEDPETGTLSGDVVADLAALADPIVVVGPGEDEPVSPDDDDLPVLRYGDKDNWGDGLEGTPVADLQRQIGGVAVTGHYGGSTLRKVRRIQAENGLIANGVVDAATRAVL